jgi:hypothetical protein
MTKNLYYEYRKWVFFWGLGLDQKIEVQKVLDQHNPQGWKVVQFEWGSTKLTIFRLILILLVTFLTLGFVSYWVGFSIIFEREEK